MFAIFLDESGDLGFDFINKKPSTHFCITVLVCKDKKTTLALKSVVKNTLVRTLNFNKMTNPVTELKGINTTLRVKKYFYSQLEKFAYPILEHLEVYSISFDKRELLNFDSTPQNQHKLYNFLTKELLGVIDFSGVKEQVLLYIDRSKGYQERKIFDTYIQLHLEVKLPLNTTLKIMHDFSHNLAGLQAVDLFCYGLVRKHSVNDTTWYDIFSKVVKEEILWIPKF